MIQETKNDKVNQFLSPHQVSLSSSSGKTGSNALCKGKLVNAWGLGGLCKAHSNPGAHLSLSIRK